MKKLTTDSRLAITIIVMLVAMFMLWSLMALNFNHRFEKIEQTNVPAFEHVATGGDISFYRIHKDFYRFLRDSEVILEDCCEEDKIVKMLNGLESEIFRNGQVPHLHPVYIPPQEGNIRSMGVWAVWDKNSPRGKWELQIFPTPQNPEVFVVPIRSRYLSRMQR